MEMEAWTVSKECGLHVKEAFQYKEEFLEVLMGGWKVLMGGWKETCPHTVIENCNVYSNLGYYQQ
jgi:hypothetical protein